VSPLFPSPARMCFPAIFMTSCRCLRFFLFLFVESPLAGPHWFLSARSPCLVEFTATSPLVLYPFCYRCGPVPLGFEVVVLSFFMLAATSGPCAGRAVGYSCPLVPFFILREIENCTECHRNSALFFFYSRASPGGPLSDTALLPYDNRQKPEGFSRGIFFFV